MSITIDIFEREKQIYTPAFENSIKTIIGMRPAHHYHDHKLFKKRRKCVFSFINIKKV